MIKKEQENQKDHVSIRIDGGVGPGAAVGPDAHVRAEIIAGGNVTTSTGTDRVADAFARIYAAIDTKPLPSETDAQDVRETIELIKEENDKGGKANEKVVRLSFNSLAQMAPDIWEVAVTTLCNPLLGISTVVKKIAEKAKAEMETKDSTSAAE